MEEAATGMNEAAGKLSHLDEQGNVRMVDVGGKDETHRLAVAAGTLTTTKEVIDSLRHGAIAKGNVLTIAKTAGIMAAKRTAQLIPLCHPLLPDHIDIDFEIGDDRITITARVTLTGRTGAEMEALTAVSLAALTIYDMCKAVDRTMVIGNIRLLEKSGGKSGHFKRTEAER